jgi:hypothetical protein
MISPHVDHLLMLIDNITVSSIMNGQELALGSSPKDKKEYQKEM